MARFLQCRHQKDEYRIVLTKDSQVIELFCCTECRNTIRDLSIIDILEERMTKDGRVILH